MIKGQLNQVLIYQKMKKLALFWGGRGRVWALLYILDFDIFKLLIMWSRCLGASRFFDQVPVPIKRTWLLKDFTFTGGGGSAWGCGCGVGQDRGRACQELVWNKVPTPMHPTWAKTKRHLSVREVFPAWQSIHRSIRFHLDSGNFQNPILNETVFNMG